MMKKAAAASLYCDEHKRPLMAIDFDGEQLKVVQPMGARQLEKHRGNAG